VKVKHVTKHIPFIWAHRGASAVAPENTMASFYAALHSGANGIELDIHLSRDGIPVVIHDLSVDRTTNGQGLVAELTLRELQTLDAGHWFAPMFIGERIPTLFTVLERFSGRLRLNLEIKDAQAGLIAVEMLKDFPAADALISSFDWRLLVKIREVAPKIALAVLLESQDWHFALSCINAIGASALHPRIDRINKCLLLNCQRRDIAVSAWTVDDPRLVRRIVRQGINAVFCNNPGFVRESLVSRRF
jgi:glycerophosphoryl diester phosphodiesterase